MMRLVLIAAVLGMVSLTRAADGPAKEREGMPLLFHEDFADPERGRARFELFESGTEWKMEKDGGRNALAIKQSGKQVAGLPRAPFNRAWVKDLTVGAFVMEVKLKTTERDYGHRDMCLLFGGQDPSHFYYAHLGQVADPRCNAIFVVDGKDRENVTKTTNEGVPWDSSKWQTVRIERKESGEVAVYFEGEKVMTSEGKGMLVGRVGVGTFDDKGMIGGVTVWGVKK